MKKILLVDGIYPPNTRSRRILKTLEKKNKTEFCLWDRNKKSVVNLNYRYVYCSDEGYGNRMKKLFGIPYYYKYIKKVLKEYEPDILIASQWDMLILCSLLKNKKQKLVYENIDMPTSKNKIILIILKMLEKIYIKNVDGIIYASRFFKDNYKKNKIKELILENKPTKFLISDKKDRYTSNKIKLAFIGTLRYFFVLEKLINSAKKYEKELEVLLIGEGPDEKKLKELVEKNAQKNIIFFGKYEYEDISKFYNISDLIWAVYPSEDYNVKYAISNKFHESIIFEKPGLFSKKTLLGEYVSKNNIGLTIEIDEIDILLEKICKNKINFNAIKHSIKEYKMKNPNLFWEDDEKKLIEFIKEL